MQTVTQVSETISRTLTTTEVLTALGADPREVWNNVVDNGDGQIHFNSVIQQPQQTTGTV